MLENIKFLLNLLCINSLWNSLNISVLGINNTCILLKPIRVTLLFFDLPFFCEVCISRLVETHLYRRACSLSAFLYSTSVLFFIG